MPMFRVQLKQGSRTIVNHLEADKWEDILAFYEKVSTMQVSEILEVRYKNDTKPPIDDFNYKRLYKGIIRNEESHISRQIILHNLKLNINSDNLSQYIKQYLKIRGKKIDGVLVTLFRS